MSEPTTVPTLVIDMALTRLVESLRDAAARDDLSSVVMLERHIFDLCGSKQLIRDTILDYAPAGSRVEALGRRIQ